MKQARLHQIKIIPISQNAAILAENKRLSTELSELKQQLKNNRTPVEKNEGISLSVIVHVQGIAHHILLSRIIMMKSDSNYTTICLTDGTHILTSKTLKYWDGKIKENPDFIRPHRSFIVNKAHIVSYQASSKLLELTGGKVAKVSRTFKF